MENAAEEFDPPEETQGNAVEMLDPPDEDSMIVDSVEIEPQSKK